MARKLVLRKRGGGLFPRDAHSEEIVSKLSPEKDVVAEIKQSRSIPQLRFMFALLNLIAENHPTLTTVDDVLRELKIRARLFDPIAGEDGKAYFMLRSLSFESMDHSEFSELFEKSFRPIIREHLLPGVTDERVVREVLERL